MTSQACTNASLGERRKGNGFQWERRAEAKSAAGIKNKVIARCGLRLAGRAGGKFENGVSSQTDGQPPRQNAVPDLYHSMTTIEIDQIDGKAHPEGVNRFAGNDPETFPLIQAFTPQKTPAAGVVISGELDKIRELSMASEVEDLDIDLR